ncbi:MAG TPA: M48 family metallopeptidase [Magnetospirillaceae bacterium]|nr:M48 family metallopeptidase [Magnetospirillaceae bacterium]
MAIFIVIISGLGWIFSTLYNAPSFLYMALIIGGVYALVQYFAAAKIALAVNGAREIQKSDNPRLYRTVENLCITTGMPMPKVYIIDDPGLNAFATGRDPAHAVVCATVGLLELMTDTELEAVMAHELGHIQNYDIRVMMIVFGLVSAIGFIADMLMHMLWWRDEEDNSPWMTAIGIAAAILAPIVALFVQLAISRQREYLADGTSAMTTRHPLGLVSALKKIEAHGSSMRRQNALTAHLFFANPLKGNAIAKLLSTHPPIADRISRLETMGTKL